MEIALIVEEFQSGELSRIEANKMLAHYGMNIREAIDLVGQVDWLGTEFGPSPYFQLV